MTKASNPLLYEINTRVWLGELSQGTGHPITLATVPAQEWQRLKEFGVQIVWLMGIWKPSPFAQETARRLPELRPEYDRGLPGWSEADILASPYAVADYSPNPMLGSWEDVDRLREQLHTLDLQLMVDFVPNHTALDHPWISQHPEYYIQDYSFTQPPATLSFFQSNNTKTWIAHGKDPHYPAWTDTAQLNYFSSQTRQEMIYVLQMLATHCDGVRCDMAMLVLNNIFEHTWKEQLGVSQYKKPPQEFWVEAIAQVTAKFPEFIFMAEAYWGTETYLQELGFDYTYDKKNYDLLKTQQVGELRQYLSGQTKPKHWVRFIENHDEPRVLSAFGLEQSLAAALLSFTLPGLRLLHEGQEKGWSTKLPVQLRQRVIEATHPQIHTHYTTLLALSKHPAYHQGEWQILEITSAGNGDISFGNLIAYQWQTKESQKIVVVNFSPHPSHGSLKLPNQAYANSEVMFYDELNNKGYRRQATDLLQLGLYIDLAPWQGHIFEVRE